MAYQANKGLDNAQALAPCKLGRNASRIAFAIGWMSMTGTFLCDQILFVQSRQLSTLLHLPIHGSSFSRLSWGWR
jgi:hypothetical protein